MFHVLYKDDEKRNIVAKLPGVKCMSEAEAHPFVLSLNRDHTIFEREDDKWHLAKVVFDIQKVEEAKVAIKAGKDLPGIIFTYADPKELSKEGKIAKVKNINGTVKYAYVVHIWKATTDEVKAFKESIKYPKLGIVIGTI